MVSPVVRFAVPELHGTVFPTKITEAHRQAYRDEFKLSGEKPVNPNDFRFRPGKNYFQKAPTFVDLGKKKELAAATATVNRDIRRLAELNKIAQVNGVLVVLQGVDAARKGGLVEHAFFGNPHHLRAFGFKAPTEAEQQEHYLARIRRQLPPIGMTGIFDRSHYEDIIFPTVYETFVPEIIAARYGEIQQFESELHAAGILVVKIFLHVSKEEQLKRLVARIEDPLGWGKVGKSDWKDRALREKILATYARIFEETHTDTAPWYIVPADDKHSARLIAATIVRDFMQTHYEEWINAALTKGLANLLEFAGEIER